MTGYVIDAIMAAMVPPRLPVRPSAATSGRCAIIVTRLATNTNAPAAYTYPMQAESIRVDAGLLSLIGAADMSPANDRMTTIGPCIPKATVQHPVGMRTIAIMGGAKNKFPGGFPASMNAPIVPAITTKNPKMNAASRMAT